jgi:diaminopimelate decarboxylase
VNHFEYGPEGLACEGVPLARIAGEVGTPVYVYSRATLERHFTVFRDALAAAGVVDPLIAYAVKANSNVAVLKVLGNLGAGADTVSEGEVRRALAAGIPGERIVFSGVGKKRGEIAFALRAGVAEINVESEPELNLIAAVAAELGVKAKVAFRVNPDVAAGGHAKIATGKSENKFGVSFAEAARLYANASNNANLEPIGVACHIGSQITDLTPMRQAFTKMRGLVEQLLGEGLHVERLDLGGGLGVPYFNHARTALAGRVRGDGRRGHQGPARHAGLRAGPRHRRQRRRAGQSEVIHVHERPEAASASWSSTRP